MKHIVRRVMTAGAYHVVAGIIRKIEPPELRKSIADHFATEFNKRAATFDPAQWERWTGGRPAADSAFGGKARSFA